MISCLCIVPFFPHTLVVQGGGGDKGILSFYKVSSRDREKGRKERGGKKEGSEGGRKKGRKEKKKNRKVERKKGGKEERKKGRKSN